MGRGLTTVGPLQGPGASLRALGGRGSFYHGAMPATAPSGRDAARAAKSSLAASLAGAPGIVGIGLARAEQGYVLKVNLADADAANRVPDDVDGVRVVTEVVGAIRPL